VARVFLSHSSRDNEAANRMKAWLEGQHFDAPFLDFDKHSGIPPGANWEKTLYDEIRLSQALLILQTPNWSASRWCFAEFTQARALGKPVFQVIEEDGGAAEPPISRDLQRLDLRSDREGGLAALRKRLIEIAEQDQGGFAWPPPKDPDRPPFPGLMMFEEEDAAVFFGRDSDWRAVIERLNSRRVQGGPRLLVLQGSSGAGKSSLLRAGVLPRLRRAGGQWLLLTPIRPKAKPLEALAKSWALALGRGAEWRGLHQQLQEAARSDSPAALLQSWAEDLQMAAAAPDAQILLGIDQGEELFTVAEAEEKHGFLAVLGAALSQPLPLQAVMTIRADAVGELQQVAALVNRFETLPLGPLPMERYREIIEGPAKVAGLSLEEAFVAQAVRDTETEDALPVLAVALHELHERFGGDGHLSLSDYQGLGDAAAGLSPLENAVRRIADDALLDVKDSEAELRALRDAFIPAMVRLTEQGSFSRRVARWADLPTAAYPLLERLVEKRLLVSGKAEGTLEIAHEALLRTWPTLAGWLEEGRIELEQRRRVKRLCEELNPERQPLPLARQEAMEQLARMAATGAGESEGRAARKGAWQALVELVGSQEQECLDQERADGALVLALIGAEEPLRQLLADGTAPVALRRRAAESLGLLASRCGNAEQRSGIRAYLEGWLRSEPLDVPIRVELDPEKLDPAAVQEALQQAKEHVQQLAETGRLQGLSEEQMQEGFQQLVGQYLEQRLWAEGQAAGWAEHDARLPLLQGAARGLQLAASADLPLAGSGPGRVVPMLTLRALEEDGGLRVRTEVVEVPVSALPLPGGEQLELVAIQGGTYEIGSPKEEAGRNAYTQFRQRCEDVDVEAERTVQLAEYWMVRHPISQAQWRAVVEEAPQEERGSLKPGPGSFRPEGLWEDHGQPGALPVDMVSWNDAGKWLDLLNRWLERQWAELSGTGKAPRLALPSESQWEAACRAGSAAPFHFGATLDPTWANANGNITYGLSRKGKHRRRPVPIGFFGLVNRWGLAELHGQIAEWCGDQWHRDPLAEGWSAAGEAREGMDPGLADVPLERDFRLLRGGSWLDVPRLTRAAMRYGTLPGYAPSSVGLRPCCPSPPGSLLGP
jgi:formylglycine-generating enzyme required for sulfatase activity